MQLNRFFPPCQNSSLYNECVYSGYPPTQLKQVLLFPITSADDLEQLPTKVLQQFKSPVSTAFIKQTFLLRH